ncbi:CPBP family intramembrane glutamic endopeptidase [Flavitalea antarctica]
MIRVSQHFSFLINKLATYRLIIILLFALIFQLAIMFIISVFIVRDHPGGFEYRSVAEHFVTVVIVAPVIETYIFQHGIINLTLRTIRSDRLIAVLLSATGFALTHIYSLPYIVVTFFIGFLYATLYLVFVEKNVEAFWWVTLTHSMYNLCAFVLNSLSPNQH